MVQSYNCKSETNVKSENNKAPSLFFLRHKSHADVELEHLTRKPAYRPIKNIVANKAETTFY